MGRLAPTLRSLHAPWPLWDALSAWLHPAPINPSPRTSTPTGDSPESERGWSYDGESQHQPVGQEEAAFLDLSFPICNQSPKGHL